MTFQTPTSPVLCSGIKLSAYSNCIKNSLAFQGKKYSYEITVSIIHMVWYCLIKPVFFFQIIETSWSVNREYFWIMRPASLLTLQYY